MSIEAAFESLHRDLTRLQEAVSALHVTIAEDKPARGGAVLVDHLDNLVTDLSGVLEEADVCVARAVRGIQPGGTPDQARTALREIHGLMNRFFTTYAGELAAHDRIARLLEMGRERGREWREWSGVVKTAVERCAAPMKVVMSAILDCWNELVERLARNSVSVQAMSIGQQITVREGQLELSGKTI